MRERTKRWLIAAAVLVMIGAIVFAAAMTANRWNFSRLNTVPFETNTHEISETFSSIELHTKTADILFAASSNNACRVVCYEEEKRNHTVSVQDGTLTVSAAESRKQPDWIGFNVQSPRLTIYLPEAEYESLVIQESTGSIEIPKEFRFGNADISASTGSIKLSASVSETARVKTTTGDICVDDTSVGALDLSLATGEITVSDVICQGDMEAKVTTGNVNAANVTCRNLLSTGSTSNISLKNVIADGTISIERSTGDTVFERSDAAEIFVKTSTGDVTGSLLTEKVFITETATGDVDVPGTIIGGRCEITTTTGNIKLGIAGS